MNDNGAKIIELGAHERMSVTDALELARREAPSYQEVLIVAVDRDDCLIVRSSNMARKDALWLAMMGADWARGK